MFLRSLSLTIALPLALGGTAAAQFGPVHTVFALTNQTDANEVAVALRVPFFGFVPLLRADTGGTGTAAGLGSQSQMATTEDGRWLVAVNPGSDEVSVLRVLAGVFPIRTDVQASGGDRPTSVAVHGDLVYVLNADDDRINGFRLHRGDLLPIDGASYALSGAGVAAAQVGFDPRGRHVVVTERATNQIVVFPVRRDGTLGDAVVNAAAGQTPFGFAFRTDGTLVVSEAFGGAAGASTTSTYEIRGNGNLRTISAAVPTDQTAACWIAISPDGRFAYTTNTGDASITGYALDRRGRLARLDASGRTGEVGDGARPIDFDFDRSGRFLFTLDSGNDRIVVLQRGRNGSLGLLPGAWELPDGAAGVLAR